MPTLRSFLKLYTSLHAKKLAGFLDADEEEMVQQMMAVKAASRCVSRVGGAGEAGSSLLNGQMIVTSDMDFVINEVTLLPLLSPSPLMLMAIAEHGSCRGIHRWAPVCGLVHSQL